MFISTFLGDSNIILILDAPLVEQSSLSVCIQDFGLKCLSKSFDGWNHYICPHVYFMSQSRLVIPGFREMLSVIYF